MKMHTPRNLFATLLGTAIALYASCNLASATIAVDWGGDYVSGDVSLQFPGGYSSGEPQLLSPSSSYSGTSATFYGAQARESAVRVSESAIDDNGSNDRIQLKSNNTGSGAYAFLVLWKQEDFLNGLDTGQVDFGASDTVTLNLVTYANFNPGRLVLRQGSSYYISDELFNSVTSFEETPTELAWNNYDPTGWSENDATTLTTIGSAASIVSDGKISNITEVGFLFSNTGLSNNAARIQNFEVNMTAIPEPGSVALSLGGVVLLCAWYRRQRSA